MRRRAYRPRRHLRNELYALAAVLIAPLLLLGLFPYEAVGWRADAPPPPPPASCAFVTLSDAEAEAVVAGARAAIRTSPSSHGRMWADLSLDAVPEPSGAVGDIQDRRGAVPPPPPATVRARLLPPSVAAGAPQAIPRRAGAQGEEAPPPAFPRTDLLGLDGLFNQTKEGRH